MDYPLKNIVNEPYPFNYEGRALLWLLPGIFIFGLLFLFIFQPFNNNWEEHRYPFIIICVLHSVTAVLCLLPFFLLANLWVKDKSSWTYGKELLLILFAFAAIGVGNYLIRDFIYASDSNNWALKYLLEEVKNAFLMGLIIYPLFLWLNGSRLSTKHKKEGELLSEGLGGNTLGGQKEIAIYNTSGTLELVLPEEKLLFIKADGNYISIYYQENGIQKKMIRNTLSAVSDSYPAFFRPHRSYLVNVNEIERIGGNSQGYTLHFEDCDLSIPVSRNKKKELIELRENSDLLKG